MERALSTKATSYSQGAMIGGVLRDHSQHSTTVPERETGGSYSRNDVLRLLKIDNRQLRAWERQQLVPELTHYRFSDLLLLKRIAKLRKERVPPKQIKQAQHALLKWLKDFPQLGSDVQVYQEGRRVRVQIGKQKLEPSSGQLLFDFAQDEINNLLQLPDTQKDSRAIADRVRDKLEADQWFEKGLEMEQTGAPFDEVIGAYKRAAELDPHSAAAIVNLGTVFFNGHAWADAEEQYKKALEIDSDYALAHFNLGNLYDEREDTANALYHYREALRIHPKYADVHYNLALLFQGSREPLSAMRHWRAYIKLDGTSNWAQIARRELAKLESTTVLQGNRPAGSGLRLVESGKD
jgi:tetratricopeptide (TPR) repeat protein